MNGLRGGAMQKRRSRPPLVRMRASVNQMQGQDERLPGRGMEALDDPALEIADIQVARLERRVAKVEQLVAELPRKTEQAA
jgi:hypothetical protein